MADKVYSFRIDIEDRGAVATEILKVDEALKKLNKTRADSKKLLKDNKITQEQYNKILKNAKLRETELRQSKLALSKADRSLAKQAISTKGSMEQLRQETARLVQTANQLNLATATGKKRFKEIQKQVDKNKTSIRNFDRSMSGSKTLVGEYGKGIVSSFKSMAAGLIGFTALIRVIKDITKVTGDFDTASAKLASVTLQTREEISELTEQAEFLGATTIFTATQVTELQIALAKLGFTAEEISNSTEAVVDFATATGADLGAAAKVAGVAVRAFGLDTLETADAVAALAVGTTKSALAFEDYETILSTVGPVAKSYGFTLEDTIALTGKLRDAGFDASKAATATRNILLNLADANGDLAKKLGGSAGTLDELVDGLVNLNDQGIGLNETLELTDKRSVAAFSQFLRGAGSVKELKDQVTDTKDELEEMVDLQLDSYAGDVKALSSAWQGFILSLKASDALREVTQFLKDAILQVSNLDKAFTKFHKQTATQLSESFDLLGALSNKQGQHFDEMIEFFDEMADDKLASRGIEQMAKDFAQIRNVNKKEGAALAQEYLRRRQETADKEVEYERVKQERIAKDAEQLIKNRAADAQNTIDKANEKQSKLDIKAAEKAAKEKAASDKKIAEEAARERIKFIADNEREVAKASKDAQAGILKAVQTTADSRIVILKQNLSAIQNEEAKTEEEKISQLNRILTIEQEIRQAEFVKEQTNRAALVADAQLQYSNLEATLQGLRDRLAKGDITQAFFDVQKKVIDSSMENLQETTGELETQQLLGAEQFENDLTAIKAKGAKDRTAVEKASQEEIYDTLEQSLQAAGALVNVFSDLFAAAKAKELSAAGDNAVERQKIEEEYAKKERAFAIFNAVINTALGVTKALGSMIPPFSYITAGITAAAGAAQIAVIRSQKFAEGGKVQPGSEISGMSKGGDNTLAMVKPGEVILNRGQQLALGGSDIFKNIGVPGFATGGVVGAPEPSVAGLTNGQDLADIFRTIKVVNNVNELHQAEGELEVINETSEL